ncbi:SUZ domain-containing protein 1 isoform X2 [Talpa occidentalis]|nr:SUZ domain-containing protein 1 isoform X2 [Talpa occidentalis]
MALGLPALVCVLCLGRSRACRAEGTEAEELGLPSPSAFGGVFVGAGRRQGINPDRSGSISTGMQRFGFEGFFPVVQHVFHGFHVFLSTIENLKNSLRRYLVQFLCACHLSWILTLREIDRRLEKKLKITQKERKSKSPPKVPIVIQDDSLPTGPPPQIRILKRPTSNGVVSSPNSTSRPALPVKSLAQREAEYAEARKRILGSASPEEEQEKPILDRPTRISQPEDSRQPNNVIRQPLGPDGSQGFKQRR